MSQAATSNDTVSSTAKVMTGIRVLETEREISCEQDVCSSDVPRLFSDPMARHMLEQEDLNLAWDKFENQTGYIKAMRIFTLRTRFHDDAITDHPEVKQIVILGAGLDARAYRLPSLTKEMKLWEVDTPEMIEYKSKKFLAAGDKGIDIEPKSQRFSIQTNLATSSWRDELCGPGSAFKKDIPTVWILEGFVYYLPPDSALELMRNIDELSAPGSVWAGDIMSEKLTNDSTQSWSAMWHFGCNDPESWLKSFGWNDVIANSLEETAKKYTGYDGMVKYPGEPGQYWFVLAKR